MTRPSARTVLVTSALAASAYVLYALLSVAARAGIVIL